MIQKKIVNPNIHDTTKKKKRKNRKNLLTSMTSHVKDANIDQEEDPEDGIDDDDGLSHIEEENDPGDKVRESSMSLNQQYRKGENL